MFYINRLLFSKDKALWQVIWLAAEVAEANTLRFSFSGGQEKAWNDFFGEFYWPTHRLFVFLSVKAWHGLHQA